MNLLIIKPNPEGMSRYRNGEMEVLVVSPNLVNSKSLEGISPSLVILSKELSASELEAASKFAYSVTGYKTTKSNKVVRL